MLAFKHDMWWKDKLKNNNIFGYDDKNLSRVSNKHAISEGSINWLLSRGS